MEHHKGPLKVGGGQTAHDEKQAAQSNGRPEAGAVAQQRGGSELAFPAEDKQNHQRSQGNHSYPQIQQKQHPHIGKVGGTGRGEGQHARGKVRPQAKTVVHHLVESLFDLLHTQASIAVQVQGLDVGVIEGAAQQRHRDGGGEYQKGGEHSGKKRE